MRISRVETYRTRGGESPLWDPVGQVLYFIDNFGQRLYQFAPGSNKTRSWEMPSIITALALRQQGGAVVALRSGVHGLDFESGAFDTLVSRDVHAPYVYNDGRVDRRGRFLLGGTTANFSHPAPDGGLFSLDGDHRLVQLDGGIHFSNSPCFSPDDRTFYFSDSFLHTTYAYDYDLETGTVRNKRVFFDTKSLGGMPDGSTVDRDGLIWMAIYGGGKVAAFDPNGRLVRSIELPVKLVSSVAFGGPDLDRLYVTTIQEGALGEPAEEGAGYVYLIEGLGARGLPEPLYNG
ncbi:MAG TPA: SMP-30/gluconolactonase/LRE family protein [Steroidobacteraceae bacterium]|jgi:sugar lactone lactonase YvrE|nr:SMP-30/gluconolactonase/LRE family protein [Steroidobacteraceae bacterium]